jgi:hypothetical protein
MAQPSELKVLGDGNTDGVTATASATEKFSLYGETPVIQRADSAHHTTTKVVTSASFGTLQVAQAQELMLTLSGLGAWTD